MKNIEEFSFVISVPKILGIKFSWVKFFLPWFLSILGDLVSERNIFAIFLKMKRSRIKDG